MKEWLERGTDKQKRERGSIYEAWKGIVRNRKELCGWSPVVKGLGVLT